MNSSKKVECSECKRVYKRYSELRRHVKQCHKEKLDVIAPLNLRTYKFKCHQCNNQFNYKAGLNYHVKKQHGLVLDTCLKPKQKCALCDYVTTFKKDCITHYETTHNIPIGYETIGFDTYDEFTNWKATVEKETTSRYVIERTKSGTTSYICHRSGFFITESQGKRRLKKQGSNKINGFCPAMIRVTKENGKHLVYFIKTHVGHENRLSHISLTSSERNVVANKLAASISLDDVLNEVRDSISSSSSLERMHLLTKKDLYNIKASFNIQSAPVSHQKIKNTFKAWVIEMKDKCVLFYKPQGSCIEGYPQLKSEDFLLIIMNNCQTNTLRKYSSDYVCIDEIEGNKINQYKLHTLMVLDDLSQGFPCAFCISSRTDETIMTMFFECIRSEVGVVTPKAFMSDMSEIYYNAWFKVMTEVQFCLYCTWHVDKAWRENLALINSKYKQSLTYKTLRTLLQEPHSPAFEGKLKMFMNQVMDDPDTQQFGVYFNDNFVTKSKSWAYCYRLHYGLNTNNTHIERMHCTIEYIYSHGKKVKKLEKAINDLMKFIRDTLFDRLIILNKGKLHSKLTELRKRHEASEDLDTSLITQHGSTWQIADSSEPREIFTIDENDNQCDCQLVCQDCQTCIHQFSCSCVDSAIMWNMCKHIHLLCRSRQLEEPILEIVSEGGDLMEIIYAGEVAETEIIFERRPKNNQSMSRNTEQAEKKEAMLRKFYTVVNKINTAEELEVLEEMVNSVESTLESFRQQRTSNEFFDIKTT